MTVSWPGVYCNDRVCSGATLSPAEGSRGIERAETEGKLRISSAAGRLLGTGDKGYLESGEIDGLLTNMVAREGRDKVVNRETHDCGIEEEGWGRRGRGGEDEVSGSH